MNHKKLKTFQQSECHFKGLGINVGLHTKLQLFNIL